jgi:hypothetical protein
MACPKYAGRDVMPSIFLKFFLYSPLFFLIYMNMFLLCLLLSPVMINFCSLSQIRKSTGDLWKVLLTGNKRNSNIVLGGVCVGYLSVQY